MQGIKRHEIAMRKAVDILNQPPYANHIDSIYLYGSCARQEQRYDSDVDLLVQCRAENPMPLAMTRSVRIAVMPEERDLPEVELKFVVGDRWRGSDDCFSRNLVREGKLLWKNR